MSLAPKSEEIAKPESSQEMIQMVPGVSIGKARMRVKVTADKGRNPLRVTGDNPAALVKEDSELGEAPSHSTVKKHMEEREGFTRVSGTKKTG